MAEGKSMQLSYAEARREIYRVKVANQNLGWSPRLRQWFGYFTPDECYEATLFQMVEETTDWLDVGCGHDPFPTNQGLAALLSSRCHLLVGVDPSPNIARNTFVHESARTTIENYHSERTFDLISLRMVAEHIASPDAAIAAFSRLTK